AMRVSSPLANFRAWPDGSHLRLNDPEPSLFPSRGASELISVAVCHAGVLAEQAGSPRRAARQNQCSAGCKSSTRFKKLSSVHNLKFFGVSTLSVVAWGEELNKTEGLFDAHRTSGALDRSHPAKALWRH